MRRIAIVALATVVVVLIVSQLVLPGIAAQQLRDRLSSSGPVLEVQVHAFPAIKLLWHRADRVVVRMQRYRSSTSHLGSMLAEAGDAGSLDASTNELDAGLLTLRDARLSKRGSQLTGSARVGEDDLRAAVPILDSVQPLASPQGTLTLRGTATLFGVTASVDATVAAQDGKLVVAPDVPFGGLATITAFSNPRVAVEEVAASPAPGGFSVSATGALR